MSDVTILLTLFHSATPERQAVTEMFLRYWAGIISPSLRPVGIFDLQWDEEELAESGWTAYYLPNEGIPYRKNWALRLLRPQAWNRVLLVDSDDLISRAMLERLLGEDADVVRCRSRYIYDVRRGQMAYLDRSWGDNMGLVLSRQFIEEVRQPWDEHYKRPWKAFTMRSLPYVGKEVILDPCALDAPVLDIKCGDNRWGWNGLRYNRHTHLRILDGIRCREVLSFFPQVASDEVFSGAYRHELAFGEVI